MREAGLDISQKIPRQLTLEMMEKADRVITMGCGAEKVCPANFVPMEDWQLEDPEGKSIEEVRQIRDAIRKKVATLIKELSITEARLELKGGEK
jgi:arsenate reductase